MTRLKGLVRKRHVCQQIRKKNEMEEIKDGSLNIQIESLKENTEYLKCPRCWHYHHTRLNFMEMCDKCCQALLEAFTNDGWQESFPEVTEDEARRYVEGIRSAYAAQREIFGVK